MTKQDEKEYYILRIPKPKRLYGFLKKHTFVLLMGSVILMMDVVIISIGFATVKQIPNISLHLTVRSHDLFGYIFGVFIVVLNSVLFYKFIKTTIYRSRRK